MELFALVWSLLALFGVFTLVGVVRKSKSGATRKEKILDLWSQFKGE